MKCKFLIFRILKLKIYYFLIHIILIIMIKNIINHNVIILNEEKYSKLRKPKKKNLKNLGNNFPLIKYT